MKIKTKIIMVLAIAALVLGSLFVLKSYYGDKLGVLADTLNTDKIKVILSKDVVSNDFVIVNF